MEWTSLSLNPILPINLSGVWHIISDNYMLIIQTADKKLLFLPGIVAGSIWGIIDYFFDSPKSLIDDYLLMLIAAPAISWGIPFLEKMGILTAHPAPFLVSVLAGIATVIPIIMIPRLFHRFKG